MAFERPSQPFSRPVPDVHLTSAPAVRVLAQMRFPASTSLAADPSAMNRIVAALAEDYPIYQEGIEASFQIVAGAAGQQPIQSSQKTITVRSSSGKTGVTVSPTSITYETSEYDSRQTFVKHLQKVLDAALLVIRPALFERIGVRYSNLLTRDADLAKNIHSPLFAAEEVAVGGVHLYRGISETVYNVNDGAALLVRSALLPPGVSIDPGLVVPNDGPGVFLLDLDGFTPGSFGSTDVASVLHKVEDLAEIAAGYFLWSLTPEGAAAFGATTE